MLGRILLAALFLGVAVSGCVQPPSAGLSQANAHAGLEGAVSAARLPPPDKDLSHAIVSDHGAPYMHALPNLHTGSYRMDLVGYNPLQDDPLTANSAFTAVTIWHHLACVSHFAGTGGFGGATIVDFNDPKKPVVVSTILSTAIGSRCQFTDDGKHLLLADYGGENPGLPDPVPDAAKDVAAFGVSVYDVSDLKNPKFLFHDSQGQTPGDEAAVGSSEYHNVGTADINGTTYVYQTYTGNILALAKDAQSMKIVAHVEATDHDVWVGQHPITGTWMLVSGKGDGTVFYSLKDPTHPELLGVYKGNQSYQGWHRQWPLAQTVDGKAIMVVAGEECGNGKSLPYTVLDWTDPTDIKDMGHWQIPGNPAITEPGQLCSMNSHEFNTFDGYVATGNYHAGVWIFDVGSAERLAQPVTIGYYEPHENPLDHGATRYTPFAWNPDTWGAYFDDRGYVVTCDWATGFYVLKVPGLTRENATA
ncbi:MAG: hypothetical protein QOE90_1947 [Thermoplasmata archaeon]|nr:hypothetical protein [Thermoplasmata archaeon]